MNRTHHKIKAVHIHTDHKFVITSQRFDGDYFDNTIIIFGQEKTYNGFYRDSHKFYENNQIDEVIELCKMADLIVLYDLDVLKSRIALALPKGIIIAWRFFGYELYKRMKDETLSQKSQVCLQAEQPNSLKKAFKKFLRPIYHHFKYGGSPDDLFHRAINRIDYILMISKLEHTYLSRHWTNLPKCIELPVGAGLFSGNIVEPNMFEKKNKIIIGNSRNINNNHLDIIDMIDKAINKEKYQFELFFNYGTERYYTDVVRQAVQRKPYYCLIEDFMPKEEFDKYYKDVSALVINGYRQMAMGNIFHALKHGVKVYLNKKNVMLDWLLENGIKVYAVDSLVDDIEKDNLKLDPKTAEQNFSSLKKLHSSYSHEDFQRKVYERVTNLN